VDSGSSTPVRQLRGWKEIAAYLRSSERTAQRWERERGLPVRRVPSPGGRDVVFASPEEIDHWWHGQPPDLAETPGDDQGTEHRPDETSASESPRRRAMGLPIVLGVMLGALTLSAIIVFRSFKATPTLTVDSKLTSHHLQGELFSLVAHGLTPCGPVIRQYSPPTYPVPGQITMPLGDTADARGELRFSLMAGCDLKDEEYHVQVIDTTTGRKTPTVSAIVASNPQCGPHLADLEPADVRVDRTAARTGDVVTVTFAVRNIGGTQSVPGIARLRWGAPARTNIADNLFGEVPTPALKPGETVSLNARGRVPDGLPSGSYAVWVIADADLATLESRSKNNFVASPTIQIASSARPRCQ
jgi:hypothetical protein